MQVLITGAGGFVGGHLIRHLIETTPHINIHGTTLPGITAPDRYSVAFYSIDLKNTKQVNDLIADIRPDHIYHLAAQAFVPRSFEAPWETLENNILAQLNIIQTCLRIDIQPRMLVISSAEVYGPVQPHELPITEKSELRPTSPYSVSKITQDMLGLQYYLSHNFPIMRSRSFNHFGPGQNENFVAPAFALQIARIEAGLQQPVIHVGDLSAQRDFTDVRDIVRAYRLIMEHGTPGDVYNVASGQARSIQSLLDGLLTTSSISIEVAVDPDRLRPVTVPILQGDYSQLNQATGWQPEIPFEQSLVDILDDCRQRIQNHEGE